MNKQLKIRASQVGSIMSDPRGKSFRQQFEDIEKSIESKCDRLNQLSDTATKTRMKLNEEIQTLTEKQIELKQVENFDQRMNEPNLSETTKSSLVSIFWEREFGIKKHITSRFFDKGNECEQESIDLASEVNGWEHLNIQKNEDHFENDFVTGTPDIITPDFICDIKTSWTAHTFPLKHSECPESSYYWQIMTYLLLTGRDYGVLTYCLVDTPEMLVQDELFRYARNNGLIECPDDVELEIRESHLNSRLPKKLRVKNFIIERNEDDIQRIIKRVEECREWYDAELLSQVF